VILTSEIRVERMGRRRRRRSGDESRR